MQSSSFGLRALKSPFGGLGGRDLGGGFRGQKT
jgi:hypothetical protein